MPNSRSNKNLNRTLLILLGIILACLLTLNARSFYSANLLTTPKANLTAEMDKNASSELLDKINLSSIGVFIEKITSLK